MGSQLVTSSGINFGINFGINYGANDGALVLPLTSCDYRDYRPTIQASVYASTGERCLPAGRWDEPQSTP